MRLSLLVASLWLVTSPLWGKIVFYSKRDGNTEVYTMNSDGTNQTRLTFNEARDSTPVWSPNGRQIAFHSYRDGNAEVYVMDADGSNQRNLTRRPAIDGYPDWSPDGNQIVFDSNHNRNEDQMINLFIMDADGSNVKQITDLPFASKPRWSPDGEWILFESGVDIDVIRIDGTGQWKVSERKPNTGMFLGDWSPGGNRILYTEAVDWHVNSSFPVIATLHPAGRQKVFKTVRVPVPRRPFKVAMFSADGESILFSGQTDGAWNIYRFGLVDKELIQLTDNPGADVPGREWNPRLSVPSQPGLLPQYWGEIKAPLLPH